MARPVDRKTCKTCRRHRDEVGPMTWSGQCFNCGEAALRENVAGISLHSGPAFDRWRRAMAASVGAVIVDDDRLTA